MHETGEYMRILCQTYRKISTQWTGTHPGDRDTCILRGLASQLSPQDPTDSQREKNIAERQMSIPYGGTKWNMVWVLTLLLLYMYVCVYVCTLVYVLVCTYLCVPGHAYGDQRRALAVLFYNSLPYYFEAGYLLDLQTHGLARQPTNFSDPSPSSSPCAGGEFV